MTIKLDLVICIPMSLFKVSNYYINTLNANMTLIEPSEFEGEGEYTLTDWSSNRQTEWYNLGE